MRSLVIAIVAMVLAPPAASAAGWTRPVDVARKPVSGYVTTAVAPDGRATVLWTARRERESRLLARDIAPDGRMSAPVPVARAVSAPDAVAAPSGAVAVCWHGRAGRPMVAVRPAGATAWRVQRLAPRSVHFVFSFSCGVDDAGGVVAVWQPDALDGIVEAVAAPYGAPVEPVGRFGGAGYTDPQLAVAPNGAAVLAYGRRDRAHGADRGVLVAERLPGAPFGPAVSADEGAIGAPVAHVDPAGTVTLAWARTEPRVLRITTGRVGGEPAVQDIPGVYTPGRILQAGDWMLLTAAAWQTRTQSRPAVSLRAPGETAWPAPVLRPPDLPGSPAAIMPGGTVLETWWSGPPGGPREPTPFGRVRAAVLFPDGSRELAPRMSPRQRGGVYYEGFGSAAGLLLVWTQPGRSERVDRVRVAAYH